MGGDHVGQQGIDLLIQLLVPDNLIMGVPKLGGVIAWPAGEVDEHGLVLPAVQLHLDADVDGAVRDRVGLRRGKHAVPHLCPEKQVYEGVLHPIGQLAPGNVRAVGLPVPPEVGADKADAGVVRGLHHGPCGQKYSCRHSGGQHQHADAEYRPPSFVYAGFHTVSSNLFAASAARPAASFCQGEYSIRRGKNPPSARFSGQTARPWPSRLLCIDWFPYR